MQSLGNKRRNFERPHRGKRFIKKGLPGKKFLYIVLTPSLTYCMVNIHIFCLGMSELWREEALFDYTLVTSDGKRYRTHKAFLASVSDYFKVSLGLSTLNVCSGRARR